MNDISKDKDYQEFFAGIKELAKGLMQIRERAAIEYAPIVEEFCARKYATANEVGRMLDYLFVHSALAVVNDLADGGLVAEAGFLHET